MTIQIIPLRKSASSSAACILFFLAGSAVAAPMVEGLSGTISHDATVTISGTGFKTKSTASPIVWDNFEDGSVNNAAKVGSWSSVNSLILKTTQNRHPFSKNAAYTNMTGEWPNYSNAYLTGGSNSTTWFVQYWVYLGANFNFSSNIDNSRGNVKFFRMWDSGSDSKNFVAAFHEGNHVCALVEQCTTAGPTCYMYDYNPTTELDNGKWNLLQFEYRESSAANVADGVWRMWSNGRKVFDFSNLTTKCTDHTSNSRPFIVGFFDSHSSGGTNSDFFLDEAYADNTWSRIEIGNDPIYANSTQREIQIPKAWADGSITFTVNQGSFTSGSTAYLFVVDSTGAVNPNGYPITIGGGNNTLLPPTNLRTSQ